MDVHLIVGLGNPGERYVHTRHNVGFDVVSILSEKLSIPVTKRRSRALVGEGVYKGIRLALAKPQTFMNLSGESVAPLMQWYKVTPERLIVVYDDVDLPPGSLRVRASGSSGTHNGMRSVIDRLGREDFPRVRVGIGSPPPGWDMADWVTAHYESPEARRIAFEGYLSAADAVLLTLTDSVEAAMRQFNRKPPKEQSTPLPPAQQP